MGRCKWLWQYRGRRLAWNAGCSKDEGASLPSWADNFKSLGDGQLPSYNLLANVLWTKEVGDGTAYACRRRDAVGLHRTGGIDSRIDMDGYSKPNSKATALPSGSSTSSISAAVAPGARPCCSARASPRYSTGRKRRIARRLPLASESVMETTG